MTSIVDKMQVIMETPVNAYEIAKVAVLSTDNPKRLYSLQRIIQKVRAGESSISNLKLDTVVRLERYYPTALALNKQFLKK